ncbi:MAG TPA: DUF4395 domain-containing protein [Geobacteraceae bacterium]
MQLSERTGMRKVDQNELRVNSALVVLVLVTAFVVDRWELVAFQAGALLLTTLQPGLGPYVILYRRILRPIGMVKPDLRTDNPEPHRFATMFGTIVASIAMYLLSTGHSITGWGLVWLLIFLASAGFAGWCAGCFTYYMMNRLGVAGLFEHAPLAGTFPGARPPKDYDQIRSDGE